MVIVGMTDVMSVRTQRLLIHLLVLLLKKATKLNLKLDKVLDLTLAVEHGISIIQVRLLTVLDIGVIIVKWKQEKLRVVMWKMLNTSFYKATFCKMIKGFLEDVEVRMIDKTQDPDPTKREYYWMRTLKTFFSDGLNIQRDY